MQGNVEGIDFENRHVNTDFGNLEYDYLLLACGAGHSYFGNEHWERHAPGLKTIENATEIRRRILQAFERAERIDDSERQRKYLTFVIVGGGPTGVELAGAIGEMSRFTLARDFRRINSKSTRVFLMEGGPQILSAFPKELSDRACQDLESLGVQIWTNSLVTKIDEMGVQVGDESIAAGTVIWAAGVQAPAFQSLDRFETDSSGRIVVQNDLQLPGQPRVFVAGDQAHFETEDGEVLPGLAPVATQQGAYVADWIQRDVEDKDKIPFQYIDKGIMATVGRNRAIAVAGNWKFTGRFAWFVWLVVHIFFLTGFRNRIFVVLQWAWSYLTYRRGARLIVGGSNELDRAHTPAATSAGYNRTA